MTKEKEQWLRYRREIKFLLQFENCVLFRGRSGCGFVSDYFSDNTIREMKEREPFEGIEYD